jgi:hypothetical protein
VGEIYIVQDRTVALLRFLKAVADDCGLPSIDRCKSFESKFKKSFELRLRERHRITHAHERPSLASLIIDLSGAKWTGSRDVAEKQVMEVLATALPLVQNAREAAGYKPPTSPEDFEMLHESYAKEEARLMLKLVSEALMETITYAATIAD